MDKNKTKTNPTARAATRQEHLKPQHPSADHDHSSQPLTTDFPLAHQKQLTTTNCNAGNDVELLYSDRDENGIPRDLHCYEYAMDKLGEGGLSSYEDDNIPNSDWYVRKCPRWANQGCFRGNQIWQEGPNPFDFKAQHQKVFSNEMYSNNVLQEPNSATHSIKDVQCSH